MSKIRRESHPDLIMSHHTYRDDNGGPVAYTHTKVTPDAASCKVPKGGTITLEEWKRQQANDL